MSMSTQFLQSLHEIFSQSRQVDLVSNDSLTVLAMSVTIAGVNLNRTPSSQRILILSKAN